MNNTERAVDVALLTIGTTTGLANIEHTLGIIILIIQLAWIVTKLAYKVYTVIKNKGSLDDLDDDVGSVIDTFEDVIDTLGSEKYNVREDDNLTE